MREERIKKGENNEKEEGRTENGVKTNKKRKENRDVFKIIIKEKQSAVKDANKLKKRRKRTKKQKE